MSANETMSESSTGGMKAENDERYDLIPPEPLRLLARHYGVGARKYDARNWEKGYEWHKSFASLNRHAWQFWNGEDVDPETGTPHIIAVAWHAFALAEWMCTHPEFDDRPGGVYNPETLQWERPGITAAEIREWKSKYPVNKGSWIYEALHPKELGVKERNHVWRAFSGDYPAREPFLYRWGNAGVWLVSQDEGATWRRSMYCSGTVPPEEGPFEWFGWWHPDESRG